MLRLAMNSNSFPTTSRKDFDSKISAKKTFSKFVNTSNTEDISVVNDIPYNHREVSVIKLKDDHKISSLQYADTLIDRKFRSLVTLWKKETSSKSLISDKSTHPAYQQIISMGEKAIPLLLRELTLSPDHWFWALRTITRTNPVKPEHRGKIKLMTKDWLDWGRQHGYERP